MMGKTRQTFIKEGIIYYTKKLKPFTKLSIVEIKVVNYNKDNIEFIKTKETKNLIKRFKEPANYFILDEKGEKFNSTSFSKLIEKFSLSTVPMTFVIGGAYGLNSKILPSSSYKISFSEMTLNHQIIRLVFLEQLYRAFTIIKGTPYHH